MTVFKERVAELRPAYLPPDPTSRTSYVAGEIAQCDLWFPPIELPVGFGQTRTPAQLPVLTMVTGYSRWLSARLIPTRRAEDLFAGWWRLMVGLEAVPRTLVWDGEGAIGRWRGGKTELTVDCQGFRGVLGTKVIVLKPREPEHKGIVERAHDYLERSFLPGPHLHRAGRLQRPDAGLAGDGQHPPPPGVGVRADRPDRRGPGRDAGVAADPAGHRLAVLDSLGPRPLRPPGLQRLLGPPGVIGRRIEVVADLDRVKVFCEGRVVADHRTDLGLAPDPHRPRPPAGRQPAAPHPRRRPASRPRTGREDEVEQRHWPTTTPRSASTWTKAATPHDRPQDRHSCRGQPGPER